MTGREPCPHSQYQQLTPKQLRTSKDHEKKDAPKDSQKKEAASITELKWLKLANRTEPHSHIQHGVQRVENHLDAYGI